MWPGRRGKSASSSEKEGTTLKEAALKLGILNEQQFIDWVKPEDMLGPKEIQGTDY